jgi:hypothetical protein
MENEGTILTIDNTSMLNHIELERLSSDEILEVRSKLGEYLAYIQLKNLVLDASFCRVKLYRIVILGLASDKERNNLLLSKAEIEDKIVKRGETMHESAFSEEESFGG